MTCRITSYNVCYTKLLRVEKNGDAIVNYLKAWMDVAKDFKERPDHVADVVYKFYGTKGYKMSQDTFV